MSAKEEIKQLIDKESGVGINYKIGVTEWYDGSPLNDSRLDNDIFIKKDNIYYQKTIDRNTLLKINTIVELRLQNGYYEGHEITLLGYYQSGDKQPITYKFTVSNFNSLIDDGGAIIKSSKGSWVLKSETVSVKDFGAKGDNVTDDSESFRKTIKYAYSRSLVNTGWRHPIKIYIPNGRYIINSTIINQTSNVDAGRFVFEGETQYGAVLNINFSGFLFDNVQHFGFTTYSNLTFISNNIGKFMNMVGGGSANVQSFIFEKCVFENLNQIANVTETSMVSEVIFRDCKISGSTSDSILFSFDNEQAVNWRFYSTDIESFSGVLFDFKRGMTINFYQGSIIPQFEGVVSRINTNADVNQFAFNNNPLLNCWGVRFEMRQNAKLFVAEKSVFNAMNFYACGMGTFNQNPDSNLLEIRDNSNILFDSCQNMDNLRIKHTIDDATSFQYPSVITYRNTAPTFETIEDGECNLINNTSGSPIYIIDTPNDKISYRPFAKENRPTTINRKRIYPEENSNRFFNTTSNSEVLDYCIINTANTVPFYNAEFQIDPAWDGGYGGMIYNYEITINATQFAEGIFDSSKGLKVKLIHPNGVIIDFSNRQIKFRLIGTSTYTNTLGTSIYLELS